MKRRLLAFSGGAAVLLFSGMLVAAPVVSGPQDMSFGTVAADYSVDGTVSLNETNGVLSSTGSVELFNVTGVEAEFSVTGLVDGDQYTLILPSSTTLNGSSGDTVILDNFQSDVSSTFTANGTSQTIRVGARANLSANQLSGTYTGSIVIDVSPL